MDREVLLKYKEFILYVLFGGLTFIVSVGTYAFFNVCLELNELIANVISWIVAVTFAYVTNKKWVFESTKDTKREVAKEMLGFFGGRVFTLLIEEVIIFVFITLLEFDSMIVKIVAQVVVIILNYVISKWLVFKD